MISSRINIFTYSIFCVRIISPIVLFGELYLNFFIITPMVFGINFTYCIYLAIIGFIVTNIFANVIWFVRTDTSVQVDTCMEPELNVKLCARCDRSVPPRCTHCEYCNECIPRQRGHCHVLQKCIGYFNHRYFFIGTMYSLFYSANSVAVSVVFYNKVLKICDETSVSVDYYPFYEQHEHCLFSFFFFLSALTNFFVLIFTIILLTLETEMIITGKMKQETNFVNYDRGLKKNLICMLGKRWYLVWICPSIKSTLPDMHTVLFSVSERHLPFAGRF